MEGREEEERKRKKKKAGCTWVGEDEFDLLYGRESTNVAVAHRNICHIINKTTIHARRMTHDTRRTTHDARRTTHHAPRTTHHAPRTTHHAPRMQPDADLDTNSYTHT